MSGWQINMKNVQDIVTRDCKLRQKLNITIHILKTQQLELGTAQITIQDAEQQELSFVADGNAEWYSHFGRQDIYFRAKHNFTMQSSNHAPRYLLNQLKTCSHKNLHMEVTVTLLTNTQIGKYSRYSSVTEWLRLWHILLNTIEYYSTIKWHKLSSDKTSWKNFKCTSVNEKSQPEKAPYSMIPNYITFSKCKNCRDGKKIVVGRCWGEGKLMGRA